jgi:hypothetical protein
MIESLPRRIVMIVAALAAPFMLLSIEFVLAEVIVPHSYRPIVDYLLLLLPLALGAVLLSRALRGLQLLVAIACYLPVMAFFLFFFTFFLVATIRGDGL